VTEAPAGTVRPASTGRTWLRRVLVAVLVAAAVAVLVRDRDAVGAALRGLSPGALLLSVVPAVLAMAAALGVWRSVLGALGHPLPARTAAPIFYASQLGKYLPGAVWSIASQVELTRELRIPRRTVVAVGALTLAVSVAVGLPMAALLLPPFAPDAVRRFGWVFLLAPLLLLVLHPAVLGPLLDGALRLVRREPLPVRPSGEGMARAAAWQVLVWVLLGVHAWVLVVALGAPAWPGLPVAVGAYALAYPVGLLSLLPGGAGAREAGLTLALSTVLPAPSALLFAVLSRATLVLVDLGLAAVAALSRRR
jgi:uncharacterized membrane protein YbhN (UPF0104 family)